MTKCRQGCTCGRHSRESSTFVGRACESGCTCGRHKTHQADCECGTCARRGRKHPLDCGCSLCARCDIGCTCGKHRNREYTDDRAPTYRALHARVAKSRGDAVTHQCVECGEQAAHWSQVHGTTGTDVDQDFRPMCQSCHFKYDDVTKKRKITLQRRKSGVTT